MSTGKTWDVVGLGENSVDYVYQVRGRVGLDAKLEILARRVSPGGQVATALCTCAKLGLRSAYNGAFGNDVNARIVQDTLADHGVDLTYAVTRQAPNRYAVILVDERSGERTVLWQRDPALVMATDDVAHAALIDAHVVLVDNLDEETAIAAAGLARSAGATVITDIDRVTARTPGLVAAATFPVLAEHVPSALTGEPDPEHALRALRQRHDGRLCVTLGARGAMLLDGDRLYHQPGFHVHAVDTTGAGDVFRGALIVALLRGDGPEAMLRFAAAAAAVSCTKEGAVGGVPSLREVEAVLTREGGRHEPRRRGDVEI